MQLLAVAAPPDGFHQDLLGREERQLGLEAPPADVRMHDEAAGHVLQQKEDRVGREEGLRHGDPLVGGVVEAPFEPLGGGGHRGVERKRDHVAGEGADPLRAHRVPLVRHGGRADLRGFRGLFDLPVVLEEAQVGRELVRRLPETRERVQDPVVLLARIGLAGHDHAPFESGPGGERAVQVLDLCRGPVEEGEERGLSACRALGAEEAHGGALGADRLEVLEKVGAPHRGPLSDGGRLRRLKVRVRERGQTAVLQGKRAETLQDGRQAPLHELQRRPHLDQVSVVRDVGRRRAPMDDPFRRGRREAEDAHVRHDVVAAALFLARRRLQIDPAEIRAHLGDRLVRDRQA